MAEDKKKKKNEAPEQPQKKLPMMTVVIVAVIFVAQLATIGALFSIMGGPKEVTADTAKPDAALLGQQPVEALVVQDKFPNARTGRTFVYDTEVYIVIRQKNAEKIQQQIEAMQAQISEDVREIVARADRAHLTEPTLATIKRQVMARLDTRFGRDEQGESLVEQVVLKKFTEFQM